MSHFYRELLQQSEKEHQATVAATSVVKGPTLPDGPVNLRIQRPLKPAAMSDAMLAAMAKEGGKDVELNDDNQIVDHRELLSAGLNLAGVNTRRLGGLLSSRSKFTPKPVETHRASGAAASKAEIRARQAALLQQQLTEEQERIQREKEQREHEERDRSVKRKNNDDDIKSARERYLERKKRRLEQPDTDEEI
jgi:coiled-coil domain-containing protein 55